MGIAHCLVLLLVNKRRDRSEKQKRYQEANALRIKENRRRRLGMVSKDEYLRRVRKTPEERRLVGYAKMKRYRLRERAKVLLTRPTPYRPPKPYVERGMPVSAVKVVAARRRAYVSWWRQTLWARQVEDMRSSGQRGLANAVRRRLKKALKGKLLIPTRELLGCSVLELRAHLQGQFKRGMTWANYGTVWNIDHEVPLAKFDLKNAEHLRMASHYTNLRPMRVMDNSLRGDRIEAPIQPQLPMVLC